MKDLARNLARNLARDLAKDLVRDLGKVLARDLARDLVEDLTTTPLPLRVSQTTELVRVFPTLSMQSRRLFQIFYQTLRAVPRPSKLQSLPQQLHIRV